MLELSNRSAHPLRFTLVVPLVIAQFTAKRDEEISFTQSYSESISTLFIHTLVGPLKITNGLFLDRFPVAFTRMFDIAASLISDEPGVNHWINGVAAYGPTRKF
jgi:hypothetical protein